MRQSIYRQNETTGYSQCAGYVAHSFNKRSVGVLFIASESGIDCEGKYAATCDTHNTIVGCRTKAQGMACIRRTTSFCEECREVEQLFESGRATVAYRKSMEQTHN